jgi:DEP domain-containing protein 5
MASRSESQQPPAYGRKRSNTVTSVLKSVAVSAAVPGASSSSAAGGGIPAIPALPLRTGDNKTLTTWVHDPRDSPAVLLNHAWWPGVQEGDLLQLCTSPPPLDPSTSGSGTDGDAEVSGTGTGLGVGMGGHHRVLMQVPRPDEGVKYQLQVGHIGIGCDGLWRCDERIGCLRIGVCAATDGGEARAPEQRRCPLD